MSELRHEEKPTHESFDRESFDREINVRGVLAAIGILLAVAVVVHVLMWWMIQGFERYDDKREVPLSPLPEANVQPPPPEPRLQTTPRADLEAVRKEEDRLLGEAAWVDEKQGTVRIPIADAMEVVAGRGLAGKAAGQ